MLYEPDDAWSSGCASAFETFFYAEVAAQNAALGQTVVAVVETTELDHSLMVAGR